MRRLHFDNPATLPSADRLKSVESALGVALPDDYRRFLDQTNGGGLAEENAWLRLRKGWIGQGWIRIEYFYQVEDLAFPKYELVYKWNEYSGRIPTELIPIAHDSYGNQILLGVRGKYRDKTYFWNHEEEGFDEPNDPFHNTYEITDSFVELIDCLQGIPSG